MSCLRPSEKRAGDGTQAAEACLWHLHEAGGLTHSDGLTIQTALPNTKRPSENLKRVFRRPLPLLLANGLTADFDMPVKIIAVVVEQIFIGAVFQAAAG